MKRAVFIYNPGSGNYASPTKLDHIIQRFQEKNILLQPYRMNFQREDILLELIRDKKYDMLLVSGGDGTVGAVANLMLKQDIHLPMGILPLGTCNDFARCLGIPHDLDEGIDLIMQNKVIEVDAGLINHNDYFLSSCAGGMFVDVSFSTDQDLKRNFGPFAYYLKGISEVANLKWFRARITTNEGVWEEDLILFLILNGKHAAGFNNLIYEADIADGMMDILMVKNCSHIDLAGLFLKALGKEPLEDKNIIKLRTSACRIESKSEIILSVDGEKGMPLPVDVEFKHKVLRVFVK